MAKVFLNKTRGRIIWDEQDWLAGLHPQNTASTLVNQRAFGTGQLGATKNFDPYRLLGYAAPGFNPTDLTNVAQVDALLLNMVVRQDNGYAISQGAKLHKIDTLSSTPAIVNSAPFPKTISPHATHTTVVGQDAISYTTNIAGVPVSRLFYSWYDNTDWDIGTYDYTSTFDDDFMSTVPTTPLADNYGGVSTADYLADGQGVPHPMILGLRDRIYIGSKNVVHGFDGKQGTNGTFIGGLLVLPSEFEVTSFARYREYVVVFAYKRSTASGTSGFYYTEARAYFWDEYSQDPTYSILLDDNYVTAGFEYNGTVGCFTQGRQTDKANTRTSKLQLFNGSIFEPVAYFTENVPVNGGVDIRGSQIMWNAGGTVYSFGSPFIGLPARLNKVSAGSGTSSGMLRTPNSTVQIMSSGTTTDGGAQRINQNYHFSTLVATELVRPLPGTRQQCKMRRVTIRYAQAASGGRDLGLSFVDGFGTSTTIFSSKTTVTSATRTEYYEYNSSSAPLPTFNDIKCVLSWGSGSAATDAPIVDMVEVEFEIEEL